MTLTIIDLSIVSYYT